MTTPLRDSRLVALLGVALALAGQGCGVSVEVDAGPVDAGVRADASVRVDDGGPSPDGGVAAEDAGTDAGVSTDAGGPIADAGPPSRTLFVGNSYVFVNDLPAVYDAVVASLPVPPRLEVESVTAGGRRLVQHASDATMPGHPLHTALATDVSWDHVVLQEQSQITGFPEGNGELAQSRTAAVELAGLADLRGARVVFFMTWGRRDGDSGNPGLYPDFEVMQDRLTAGYRSHAALARTAGADVVVAPVGEAFRVIFDAELDPLATGSLFTALYSGDGSHPSPAGTYLAACVFASVIHAVDATSITHLPSGMDPGTALTLREAARDAVAAEPAP